MDNALKKSFERFYNRKNILEAILVSSMDDNHLKFPRIKQFILTELINGFGEYVEDNSQEIDYYSYFEKNQFERIAWNKIKRILKSDSSKKVDPKIRGAIGKMCKYRVVNPDGPDRPYADTELYGLFKGFFCPGVGSSIFSPPYDKVIETKKFMTSLPEFQKKDIEGIGKVMRDFIEKDLEYIRKEYHW
ncbi:MAG: hypothetical protein ABH811_00075 [archaeon]